MKRNLKKISASLALRDFHDLIHVDTAAASGHVTLTLPDTLAKGREPGREYEVVDVGNNASIRNIIIDGNGKDVGGATLTLDTNGARKILTYEDDTIGWRVK